MTGARSALSKRRASLLLLEVEGQSSRLQLEAADGDSQWRATLDGRQIDFLAEVTQPGILSLLVDGRSYRCVLDDAPAESAILLGGKRFAFTVEDPRSLAARRKKVSAASGRQQIKAPMAGRIVRLLVAPGQQVEAHQGLIVVEAMKMQNELKAAQAGVVVEIRVTAGAATASGEVLIVLE